MFLVLVPFFLWVIAFMILPVLGMVQASFQHDNGQGFTLGQYIKSLTHPRYLGSFRNSIILSLFSAFVGLAVATFAAYSFTRFSDKVRDRLLSFSNVMTNFAGVPLAYAFVIIFGMNGMLTNVLKKMGLDFLAFDVYSWTGLAMVYVYFQIPVGILLIYPALYGIREEWKEASALLGASGVQFWYRIGFPVLLPSLVGTFSVLFANAMGAYATAYALTLSNFNLTPIVIGALVSGDVYPREELASALAIIMFVILIVTMLISEKMAAIARRRS